MAFIETFSSHLLLNHPHYLRLDFSILGVGAYPKLDFEGGLLCEKFLNTIVCTRKHCRLRGGVMALQPPEAVPSSE